MSTKSIAIGFLSLLVLAPVHAADETKPMTVVPPPFELKNKSTFAVGRNVRAPFIPIGWVKPSGPTQVVQKVTLDESGFRVTSILLGNPSLAVINGRSYEEGQYLRLPRGSTLRIRVFRIGDGKVWLQYDDKSFSVPLKRPELGERRPDEGLLSEDREVAPPPMATPAPGGSPAPSPAPAPAPQQ